MILPPFGNHFLWNLIFVYYGFWYFSKKRIYEDYLMIPSKIYYSMAVGSALIGIAKKESELANIINDYDCGIIIDPDNLKDLERAILRFKNDISFLNKCKNNSYNAFKNNYTRLHMSKKYGELINKILTHN